MIAAEDIAVTLGGREVVSGVSFALEAGGALAIVGASGSGKSTLLRAIAGLVPARGSVRLDGVLLPPDPRARGRALQLVFQDPAGSLHPRQTIARALAEPALVHRLDDIAGRVLRALAAVGLDPRLRFRFPHQLSGGQRQRAAIARALMLAPRLLLLDEPSSALDAVAQGELIELLNRLRRERGLAYLLVSHDLAVVAQLADRVATMDEGRIVETFAIAELAAAHHPRTAALIAASRGFRRAR